MALETSLPLSGLNWKLNLDAEMASLDSHLVLHKSVKSS